MKRFISVVLTCILILTMLPIGTFAAETKDDSKKVVDAMFFRACEVFPEYADKLSGNPKTSRSTTAEAGTPEVVVTLSRWISENESMTYTEYSNGIILLSTEQYNYQHDVSITETLPTSRTYSVNITATCRDMYGTVFSGYCRIEGLTFKVLYNGYDSILSEGNADCTTGCEFRNGKYSMVRNETASQAASVNYYIQFEYTPGSSSFLASTVTLRVQNDIYSISHRAGTPY